MGRKQGQISFFARSQCASTSIYVLGLCRRSYIRDRVDRRRFAGLREQVLERDEHPRQRDLAALETFDQD